MSVFAGVDVGNSTSEVVLVERRGEELTLLGRRAAPTAGRKGEDRSIEAAARLLQTAEQALGTRAGSAAMAPLRPVTTGSEAATKVPPTSYLLRQLSAAGATCAGEGMAVGPAVRLERLGELPADEPAIAVIGADCDFERAAATLNAALSAGVEVRGVLCGGDDAVLIGNRIEAGVPIVDEADVHEVAEGELVALEIDRGAPLRLADPFELASIFGLRPSPLRALAEQVRDFAASRSGGLALAAATVAEGLTPEPSAAPEIPLFAATSGLGAGDRYAIDLDAIDDGTWVRRGIFAKGQIALASLGHDAPVDACKRLSALIERPVLAADSEHAAGAVGALTTPGCPADAAVCDIGAGTIDLTSSGAAEVGAGGGELLTLACARALAWPPRLAEVAKRAAGIRVQSPHVGHDEDGRRRWLKAPAPAEAVGRLCVDSPDGLGAVLSADLAPEDWRGARTALKRAVIAANVDRLLARFEASPSALVIAGGVGEDREVVAMIGDILRRRGVVAGRANVAGALGPRGAVAWGLAAAASRETAVAA